MNFTTKGLSLGRATLLFLAMISFQILSIVIWFFISKAFLIDANHFVKLIVAVLFFAAPACIFMIKKLRLWVISSIGNFKVSITVNDDGIIIDRLDIYKNLSKTMYIKWSNIDSFTYIPPPVGGMHNIQFIYDGGKLQTLSYISDFSSNDELFNPNSTLNTFVSYIKKYNLYSHKKILPNNGIFNGLKFKIFFNVSIVIVAFLIIIWRLFVPHNFILFGIILFLLVIVVPLKQVQIKGKEMHDNLLKIMNE